MKKAKGNQVGFLKRLVVIDYEDCCLKLINPIIIGYSGIQECNEACLSFPNRCAKTIRPQKVTIQAQNEYGDEIMITGEDGLAQCPFCNLYGIYNGTD